MGAGDGQLKEFVSYYTLRPLAAGETVARTVEIPTPGPAVLLDVDADGAPVGIEVIGNCSHEGAMSMIVRASRW